jgi:hypothetical protein
MYRHKKTRKLSHDNSYPFIHCSLGLFYFPHSWINMNLTSFYCMYQSLADYLPEEMKELFRRKNLWRYMSLIIQISIKVNLKLETCSFTKKKKKNTNKITKRKTTRRK